MTRSALSAIAAAAMLSVLRFLVPTVGHSWAMVFIAAAHIYVGVMLTVLVQRRGRWVLGWACLAVPTAIETALFFVRGG
jgi:hypothetical protein